MKENAWNKEDIREEIIYKEDTKWEVNMSFEGYMM